jgi:beta-aspartyl-peptidase (threonine type)
LAVPNYNKDIKLSGFKKEVAVFRDTFGIPHVYADNETCAVSATGYGEDFMRTLIGKTISDFMLMKNFNGQQATAAGIEYLKRKVKGRGGVIVIDKDGNCSSGLTTKKMIHGWIEKSGETMARF